MNYFENWAAQHGMDDLDGREAAMQSDVKTYNLNKPMRLTDFEGMPADLQKEYLHKLRNEFGFGPQLAANMLGVPKDTFLSRAQALGEDWSKVRMNIYRTEIIDAREAFLRGYVFPEMQEATAQAQGEPVDPDPENKLAEERAIENRFCEAETKPTVSGDSVTALLKAFRIDLEGPMSGILRRMELFADLIGDTPAVVKLAVDEEAVYNVR